jgi:hypothetical protein
VPTHLLCVQSRLGDTFDTFIYIPCHKKLLKDLERRLKDTDRPNFLLPSVTSSYRERHVRVSESAQLISWVFKGNLSEVDLEIIHLPTD